MDVAIAWVVWFVKRQVEAIVLVASGLLAWTVITGLLQ